MNDDITLDLDYEILKKSSINSFYFKILLIFNINILKLNLQKELEF
jgi:hypothetical protein